MMQSILMWIDISDLSFTAQSITTRVTGRLRAACARVRVPFGAGSAPRPPWSPGARAPGFTDLVSVV